MGKYLSKLKPADRSFYYLLLRHLGYSSYSARRIRDFRETKIKLIIENTIKKGEIILNL